MPKEITCPCCGETFDKGQAAWTVCLGCGHIDPPGGEGMEDHPGPRGPGTDCFMGVYVYTEERAQEKAQEVMEDKGVTPEQVAQEAINEQP